MRAVGGSSWRWARLATGPGELNFCWVADLKGLLDFSRFLGKKIHLAADQFRSSAFHLDVIGSRSHNEDKRGPADWLAVDPYSGAAGRRAQRQLRRVSAGACLKGFAVGGFNVHGGCGGLRGQVNRRSGLVRRDTGLRWPVRCKGELWSPRTATGPLSTPGDDRRRE